MVTLEAAHSLYRIASFRHVVDLFESKQLRLSLPGSWGDPYEKLVDHARQNNGFAQCWPTREGSDAMWRIYSPDGMGLSIHTTQGRLAQALEDANATVPIQYYVMGVDCLPDMDALHRANQLVHDAEGAGQTVRGEMATLLVKRATFDHEAEVRAIVHLLGDSIYGTAGSFLCLPVDPHKLIGQVAFDPRADPVFTRTCSHYLRTSGHFAGEITRSRLYDLSESMIIV